MKLTTKGKHMKRYSLWILTLVMALVLVACDDTGGDTTDGTNNTPQEAIPAGAVVVDIIYAPESDQYMPKIIEDFNTAYREGNNPFTGAKLADGEAVIFVRGEPGSSGTMTQAIVNAITAPGNANVAQPTIFQPSVSHWLSLANFLSRKEIFDLTDIQPTANAPVVMAIWESRLKAIQDTVGYEDIGWEEILDVLNSENGWQDYGIAGGRRTVYYGHTDPYVSSTALSTLISEYYASARATGFTGRRLTVDEIRDEDVRDGVRQIESLIRHYSSRTTEFKNYIAQGPSYLDFVALEENDLIAINRGQTDFQPPEKLVALYPKEGTFWHEHPFGIVNADWVSEEQKDAARVFTDYMLTKDNQEYIMSFGFRPVNPDVSLGFPFEDQYGVTAQGPTTVLDVPEPDVIAAIQDSWAFVKKQADVMLVIDVSGSMAEDGKLDEAKEAALFFLDNMEITNRVGLATFSDVAEVQIPLDILETNKELLTGYIKSLKPEGGTALYDATISVVDVMTQVDEGDRIRAVIILSDGEDTASASTLDLAIQSIEASYDSINPVIVVPVAYGANADIRSLDRIAAASNTTRQSGDTGSIQKVLEILSSFF
jgi:Ca-activated chloride channel homolog